MKQSTINRRERLDRMEVLQRECELLEAYASGASNDCLRDDLWSQLYARLKPGTTWRDIIPAMIREREQALADLGLREPGVPHPRYSAPLEPGYPLDRPTPWFEKYPILERLRAYAANEEPRIPATLAEEGHCE